MRLQPVDAEPGFVAELTVVRGQQVVAEIGADVFASERACQAAVPGHAGLDERAVFLGIAVT